MWESAFATFTGSESKPVQPYRDRQHNGIGRLPLAEAPPPLTGLLLVDTLLAGRSDLFWLASRALVLPTLTLAFAVQAPILSLVRATMRKTLRSPPVVAGRA